MHCYSVRTEYGMLFWKTYQLWLNCLIRGIISRVGFFFKYKNHADSKVVSGFLSWKCNAVQHIVQLCKHSAVCALKWWRLFNLKEILWKWSVTRWEYLNDLMMYEKWLWYLREKSMRVTYRRRIVTFKLSFS